MATHSFSDLVCDFWDCLGSHSHCIVHTFLRLLASRAFDLTEIAVNMFFHPS